MSLAEEIAELGRELLLTYGLFVDGSQARYRRLVELSSVRHRVRSTRRQMVAAKRVAAGKDVLRRRHVK